MTQPKQYPLILWQGAVPSGTFRLIDKGPAIPIRLAFEIQSPPDNMGGHGWTPVNFAYADAMIVAFSTLCPQILA